VTSPVEFVRVSPGCEVAVRPDAEHLTGWVLREQGRWFESEMSLLPRLLPPGACFIDVGANVGVYSLAAAALVGSAGRVVSFEPSPEAREMLEAGVRRNDFGWVVVRGEAVADKAGTERLWTDEATELASLSRPSGGVARGVDVRVSTLDALREELEIRRVDLLKIDAEGAEARIIRGAAALLAERDPLLLHEIKRGSAVDLSLARQLAARGLSPYRHVPGLDVLAPVDLEGFVDPYQLNLFAASRARAASLAANGILSEGVVAAPSVPLDRGARRLARLPYARFLAAQWQGARSGDARLHVLLSLHAFAHEEVSAGAAARCAALEAALSLALERVNERTSVPRLLTAARLAWETGARSLAVRTLRDAIAALEAEGEGALDEPFLCPHPSAEDRPPRGPVEGMILAAAIAQHERLRAFSSFFTGLDGVRALRLFGLLGYPDEEMRRRLALLEQRAERAGLLS